MDLVAVSSGKRKALELGQVELREQGGIVLSELGEARAIRPGDDTPRPELGPCGARRPSCPILALTIEAALDPASDQPWELGGCDWGSPTARR